MNLISPIITNRIHNERHKYEMVSGMYKYNNSYYSKWYGKYNISITSFYSENNGVIGRITFFDVFIINSNLKDILYKAY